MNNRSYFENYHALETAVSQSAAGYTTKQLQKTSSIFVELFNSKEFKKNQVKVFKSSSANQPSGKLYIECKMLNGGPCASCGNLGRRGEIGSTLISNNQSAKDFMTKHGIRIDVERIVNTNCNICLTSKDEDKLLMCSKCDNGYHSYCVDIDMDDVIDKEWFCTLCENNIQNVNKGTLTAILNKVDCMQEQIFKLNKRLHDVEVVNAVAKRAHHYIDTKMGSGGTGKCKKCGMNTKTNGKSSRLSIQHVLFDIMKVVNSRTMAGKEFIRKIINESKYCTSCKNGMVATCMAPFFDTYSIYKQCMICRSRYVQGSRLSCADCHIGEFQQNHAEYKLPLHRCITLIAHSVREVMSIQTSYDMDPNCIHKHEYPVGEYGKIDFLANIKDEQGRTHMFAIEVMASKVEELTKLPHKMLAAKQNIKPFKSYFVCLDIKDGNGSEYTLLEKLEILRRWMIFAIRYGDYLPSINMWWLFATGRDTYVTSDTDYNAFYRNPLKLFNAPKAGVDWEFCTDPYMCNENDTNVFNKINAKSDHINMLFTNRIFIEGDYSKYAMYNVDSGYNSILLCKDNCEICKKLHL